MANILRLTMTDSVVANKNVSVRKSLFGFVKRGVYVPTESPIQAIQRDLDMETGDRVKRLLETKNESLPQAVESLGEVKESPIGNMVLEMCVSKDGQFAAYQLLKFVGFDYRPITSVKIFEGAEAQLMSSALH